MDILAFQRLAATALPKLNISVNQDMQVEALATVFTYKITARGAMLPQDVVVQASSPLEAIAKLRPAVARVRRAHETEKLLGALQSDWTELERETMRIALHKAYGRDGFERKAAVIRKEDQRRYDLLMHDHYENTGHYDAAA